MRKWLRHALMIVIVVCAAGWLASYWHIGTNQPGGDLSRVQLIDGALVVLDQPLGLNRIVFHGGQSFLRTLWWTDLSFVGASMTINAMTIRVFVIPLWLPLMIALALAWLVRKRAAPPGVCAGCGYDLRLVQHIRCPECGKRLARAILRAIHACGSIRALRPNWR